MIEIRYAGSARVKVRSSKHPGMLYPSLIPGSIRQILNTRSARSVRVGSGKQRARSRKIPMDKHRQPNYGCLIAILFSLLVDAGIVYLVVRLLR